MPHSSFQLDLFSEVQETIERTQHFEVGLSCCTESGAVHSSTLLEKRGVAATYPTPLKATWTRLILRPSWWRHGSLYNDLCVSSRPALSANHGILYCAPLSTCMLFICPAYPLPPLQKAPCPAQPPPGPKAGHPCHQTLFWGGHRGC